MPKSRSRNRRSEKVNPTVAKPPVEKQATTEEAKLDGSSLSRSFRKGAPHKRKHFDPLPSAETAPCQSLDAADIAAETLEPQPTTSIAAELTEAVTLESGVNELLDLEAQDENAVGEPAHQSVEGILGRLDEWLAESADTKNDSSESPSERSTIQLADSIRQLELRLEAKLQTMDSKLDACLEKIQESARHLSEQFLEALLLKAPAESESLAATSPLGPVVKIPMNEESNWESRKRQMLSDFGMTTDEIDQIVPAEKSASQVGESCALLFSQADDPALEAIQCSIKTLDRIEVAFSSTEIDQLKEQLTAQLREAEVEFSINRAKLCKEWASLEQKSAELAQREAAFKSKYANSDSENKKGLLDRFTRHLSRRS